MKNTKLLSLSLLSGLLWLTSCNNDDDGHPAHIHDHEGIHELVIKKTNLDGSNPEEFEFVAGDALGETITLTNGMTYNLEIVELNAHGHEGEEEHNTMDEIIEAIDEHFFLYSKSNTLAIDLDRTDDASSTRNDGTKIGVKTRISANSVSNGNLQIELKHQASEVDDTANDNFGSAVGGATDVLAIFPVVIE